MSKSIDKNNDLRYNIIPVAKDVVTSYGKNTMSAYSLVDCENKCWWRRVNLLQNYSLFQNERISKKKFTRLSPAFYQ